MALKSSPGRVAFGDRLVLALIPLVAAVLAAACSGSSGPSLEFQKSTAPPEATLIKGGDLPYTQTDDPRVKRSYAVFGCACTFDQVVAHYDQLLKGQGYQRIDPGTEPRARFVDSPPKDLVELSILDPRYHPASFLLQSLDSGTQEKARAYNTAYVITLTLLPY